MPSMQRLFFIIGLIVLTSLSTENTAIKNNLELITDACDDIPRVGEVIDRFNNIEVYYNGDASNVLGRNTSWDGYNLGLNYQCVEYVKRYYYYIYDHKMPDSYGHAKEFFDPALPDRKYNPKRDLYQFTNGSEYRPLPGDIIVFDGTLDNPFGHAGIVTFSKGDRCEIIQQNVGEKTREIFHVREMNNKYFVFDKDVLGWLRKG